MISFYIFPKKSLRVIIEVFYTNLFIVTENAVEQPSKGNHVEGSVEPLRRDEIINCTCGYMEEDGLMIQVCYFS